MLQIEANAEFTNKKRISLSFLPNDPAAASFLEVRISMIPLIFSGFILFLFVDFLK